MGGDRRSLHLHDDDVALIRAVAAANPRTVVAVVAGSAVVVSEWDADVPAVVQSWYSGMEGGHGLADVLLGRVDAAGRLPFSVPSAPVRPARVRPRRHRLHLRLVARLLAPGPARAPAPAYPFGFGLSYTTFALEAADRRASTGPPSSGSRRPFATPGGARDATSSRSTAVVSTPTVPERLIGFRRVDDRGRRGRRRRPRRAGRRPGRTGHRAHAMVVRPGAYEVRVARHASDPGITTGSTPGRQRSEPAQPLRRLRHDGSGRHRPDPSQTKETAMAINVTPIPGLDPEHQRHPAAHGGLHQRRDPAQRGDPLALPAGQPS